VVVTGTGAPVPGARVTAGDDIDLEMMGRGNLASTLTGEDGRFRMSRLLPGRYKPRATAAPPDGGLGQARESVLLGPGQTADGIVIELHPAAVVTGRVVVAGGETACPHGWMTLSDPRRDKQLAGTIEAGRVEVAGVLPGTYSVQVRCDGFRSEAEYAPVVVTAGASPPEQRYTVRPGARIRGTVRSAAGAPVAGVSVSAQFKGQDKEALRHWAWVSSEADGSFEMEGLAGGTYRITVEARDQPAPIDPLEATVAEGGETSIDIRLDEGGGVAGEVVDERGVPVAGVAVRAAGNLHRWGPGGATQTLDDGSFALTGLRPGTYRVVAQRQAGGGALRAPGKGDDDRSGEKVEVKAGQTARVKLVIETQSGVIRGRVVDARGAPITDAFVDAEREIESASAAGGEARRSLRWSWSRTPALTDTAGAFAIAQLSPGKYTVRAYRRGGGESLAEGIAVGTSVTLTMRATGSIAGAVSGPAPDSLTVSVLDRTTGFSRSESFFRTGGAFLIGDLPAGTFEVTASAAEGTGVARAHLADGQDVAGLTIQLAARGTVTGRLVSLDDGKPIAGFMIIVRPARRGSMIITADAEEVVSDAEGKFAVANAPAGQVQVIAFPVDGQGSGHGSGHRLASIESGRTTDLGDIRIPRQRMRPDERGGDLGFTLKSTPPETEPGNETLVVARVAPDGPAAKSGLQVGDVIVSVDRHDVRTDPSLYWTLTHVRPGTTVSFGLERGATANITARQP
jgi:protocatechuate 3,4-dioxygenase beta subunit